MDRTSSARSLFTPQSLLCECTDAGPAMCLQSSSAADDRPECHSACRHSSVSRVFGSWWFTNAPSGLEPVGVKAEISVIGKARQAERAAAPAADLLWRLLLRN